jgi:hypothetical protein
MKVVEGVRVGLGCLRNQSVIRFDDLTHPTKLLLYPESLGKGWPIMRSRWGAREQLTACWSRQEVRYGKTLMNTSAQSTLAMHTRTPFVKRGLLDLNLQLFTSPRGNR